jgi:hypothetical protein
MSLPIVINYFKNTRYKKNIERKIFDESPRKIKTEDKYV